MVKIWQLPKEVTNSSIECEAVALKYALNLSMDQGVDQAALPINSKKITEMWMTFSDDGLLYTKEDTVLTWTVAMFATIPIENANIC